MKKAMIVILIISLLTFAVQVVTMKPITEYKTPPSTNTTIYHLVFGMSITVFGYAGYGPSISPIIITCGTLILILIMKGIGLPGMVPN